GASGGSSSASASASASASPASCSGSSFAASIGVAWLGWSAIDPGAHAEDHDTGGRHSDVQLFAPAWFVAEVVPDGVLEGRGAFVLRRVGDVGVRVTGPPFQMVPTNEDGFVK